MDAVQFSYWLANPMRHVLKQQLQVREISEKKLIKKRLISESGVAQSPTVQQVLLTSDELPQINNSNVTAIAGAAHLPPVQICQSIELHDRYAWTWSA